MFMQQNHTTSADYFLAGSRPLSLNAWMGSPKKPPDHAIAAKPRVAPAAPGMVLQRERLHALIDARLPGAVWLHGPTGAGKTVLLRSYLQRDHVPSVWLTTDERHRDPAIFFAALGAAAAPLCKGGHLPAFSPEHRGEPGVFAKGYFERLDQALQKDCAIVFDDAHHLAGATAPLLARAIEAFGGRRRLCFASQLLPEAAFAPHLAGSRLWVVGHRLLAFDSDEARDLALRLGGIPAALDALVDATDGWAAGLMLAMQLGAGNGMQGSDDPLESVRTPLALLIAGQVLGGVSQDEIVHLRLLAELPQVPMELAEVAPDWAGACGRLQGLSERGLFVERLAVERPRAADVTVKRAGKVTRMPAGCWRLHDLFRSALREPAFTSERVAIGNELVEHLLEVDRLDLAWQLAARLGAPSLSRLVQTHGSVALRDTHQLALASVAESLADRRHPDIAVWYARASIGNDNVGALQACDEAYEGFHATADFVGVRTAASLALVLIFAATENVGAMAVWAERFRSLAFDASIDPDGGEHRAICLAGEVSYDLFIGDRSRNQESRLTIQDALMATMLGQELSANETMIAASLLVSAMYRAARVKEIVLAIARVEVLNSYQQAAPHIRASWNIENGYHFSNLGDSDRACRAFDAAIVLADHNALLQSRIAGWIGLARLALGSGDVKRAREFLVALEGLGPERLGRQGGWVLHLKSRCEVMSGRPKQALELIGQAERLIFEAGWPPFAKTLLDQDRVQMLYAAGDFDGSLSLASDVSNRGSDGDGKRIENIRGLLEAHSRWHDDSATAIALLKEHLEIAEALDRTRFLNLIPGVAAEILSRALAHGISREFVKRVIRARRLEAPADAPPSWPWPVRVEVLRPFKIILGGEVLEFSGKVQQKPLELLKYLSCVRDLVADANTLAEALWPDADEGSAKKNLEVTTSRLRKVLCDDTLVSVKDGKISLDRKRLSTDAREFFDVTLAAEQVMDGRHNESRVIEIGEQLQRLFVQLPLEHEEPTAWREAVRERYKAAFVRAVRSLVAYWCDAGESIRAQALLEAALEREPLAENLYQVLMQIHINASNGTEAMRVYRQCRQMLSVLIGAQPSLETERLKNQLIL
jgi:LuxR family maltose regulon positive regulatory protein